MRQFTQDNYLKLKDLHEIAVKRYKQGFHISKMFYFYYQKDGTTYIKSVNHSMVEQYFPDDTQILVLPLVCENKSNFEIMARRTSLEFIDEDDFDDVLDVSPSTITISKKCSYILENED